MVRIPLFPLHNLLLPSTDLPLSVFEERYRSLVADCLDAGGGFGVVLIKHGREVGGPAEPHGVGTYAHITQHARLPEGRFLLEVEGQKRFHIESLNGSAPYPQADVTWLPEPVGNFAKVRTASKQAETLLRVYLARRGDGAAAMTLPADPVTRSYLIAAALAVDPLEKQALLEALSADERLEMETDILRRELALLEHNITR